MWITRMRILSPGRNVRESIEVIRADVAEPEREGLLTSKAVDTSRHVQVASVYLSVL